MNTSIIFPKNKSLSIGGGNSYLFSLPALPEFLAYNSTYLLLSNFHFARLLKSVSLRNPHFLYKVSFENFLTELCINSSFLFDNHYFYHFVLII